MVTFMIGVIILAMGVLPIFNKPNALSNEGTIVIRALEQPSPEWRIERIKESWQRWNPEAMKGAEEDIIPLDLFWGDDEQAGMFSQWSILEMKFLHRDDGIWVWVLHNE